MLTVKKGAVIGALLLAACSAEKVQPQEDFSDLGDTKADSFSYRWQMVGAVESGQSVNVDYSNPPRFRAFTYQAIDGDTLDVTVASQDGDPVTWLLDGSKHVVAYNDDADDSTTNSHLKKTNLSAGTYYLVVRDYNLSAAHFTVTAQRTNHIFDCDVDTDCVAVSRGCCANGWKEAVNSSQQDSYRSALECVPNQICPLYIVNDTRVALCDNATRQCQMIAPQDIHCGGFIRNAHQCPAGWQCHFNGVPDVGGSCVQQ